MVQNHSLFLKNRQITLTEFGYITALDELDETFEDDTITDKKERTRIFGQYDHVRVYGKDYYTRLNTVGFESKGITFINTMSIEEIDRFGLPQKERIPVAVK